MGIAYQGVLGNWSGKTGNVVGRVRDNRTIYAIYQPNVSNPNTPAQIAARARFAAGARFFSAIIDSIQLGFQDRDGYKYGSAYSSALGFNLKLSQAIIWDSVTSQAAVKYDYVRIASGTLPLPYNPQGTLDGNEIAVSWSDNSGQGKAAASDKIYLVVFNPTKAASVMTDGSALRSSRSSIIATPASWSGDTVESWLFCVSSDNSLVSDSVYLGSFNL